MLPALAQFLLLTGTIRRVPYFGTGAVLFAIKFALDWTLATQVFGRPWSLLNYLIWPDQAALTIFDLPPQDRTFGLTMAGAALPFIYIGVTLTLRRLRDAGLPLALVLLFFVPLVNLILILLLCLVPSRPIESIHQSEPARPPALARRARAAHRKVAGESSIGAFALACFLSVGFTVAIVFLAANYLQSYGFGVFVAAPFVQGWLAAVLYGINQRRTVSDCLAVAFASLAIGGIILVLVAIEGLICILMAAPIAIALGAFGAFVGFAMQSRPWADDSLPALVLAVIVTLPLLTAAESVRDPELIVREVRTEVIVDTSPERVWAVVIAFPPLAEPTDLVFRTGIAYPQRAEMHGRGVGAVRHCIFSTGAFVEPIDIWDEPRCLAFRVTEQPPPMEELSPFHIHPPHLDNFLVSQRGRFDLERLPDGRTRLTGTTWYTNRMWPADYWAIWSDAIIHRVHRRVLDHVRVEAERTPIQP